MAGQLAWALFMASRGFRVFPLRPYGKKPVIDAFQHYATTDENQIRSWWIDPVNGTERNYNIGVLTTNMVLVDLDVKRGANGYAAYESQAGAHYDTFTVRTPSGGLHCYFNGPDCKQSINFLPGVDIKSHNCYVVGPGSELVNGVYTIGTDKPADYVPWSIGVRLQQPNTRRILNGQQFALDTYTAIANAEIWLQQQAPAISGQGGNNKTYQVAAALTRDFALSDETAYSLMAGEWNERCIPPWSPEELLAIVEHAFEYGVGALGAKLPEATFSGVDVVDPASVRPARELGIYLGNAKNAKDVPSRPWIVDKLLIRRLCTLLSATGSIGKSVWKLALACHLAAGKSFGAFKLLDERPMVSIVHNAEDDRDEQGRRMLAICSYFGLDFEEVRERIILVTPDMMDINFAQQSRGQVIVNEAHFQMFVGMAKDVKADLMCFDPFTSIHNLNVNDATQMTTFIKLLNRMARDADVSLLVSTHTAKSFRHESAGDANAVAGTAAITNGVRLALTMMPPQAEDVNLYRLSHSDKYKYVRIDDAKTNLSLKRNSPLQWLKWETVTLSNGDKVGVPAPYEMDHKALVAEFQSVVEIRDILLDKDTGGLSITDMIREIKVRNPIFISMPDATIKSQLTRMFAERDNRIMVEQDTLVLRIEKLGSRQQIGIFLE
jgi:hypothetical protein